MAIEIIDLLSSPDDAPPPKTKPPPARPKPPPPPARALQYDDMFDLRPSNKARPPQPPRTTVPAKRSSNASSRTSGAGRDLSFLSDDDFFDVNVDFDEPWPAKKKPRTSGTSINTVSTTSTSIKPVQRTVSSRPEEPAAPTFTFASTSTVGWGAPGVLQPAGLKRVNTTVDPIQTSSDPFATSPQRGNEPELIDLSLDDDALDPFASSPVLPKAKGRETGKSKSPQGMRGVGNLDSFSSPFGDEGKNPALRLPRAEEGRHISSSPMFVSSRAPSKMASPSKTTNAKGKAKQAVAWDHISSSAPEVGLAFDDWDIDMQPARKTLARSHSAGTKKDFDLGDPDTFDLDSDDSDDDELPDVRGIKSHKSKSSGGTASYKVTKRGTTSKPSSSKKTAAEREAEKVEKAIAKEVAKRRTQREKEEAKQERQKEKEVAAALAEVNKVKIDKNETSHEMIVDLSASLKPLVKVQVEALLTNLSVDFETHSTPVNNVVTWRRKIKARFDESSGIFVPIDKEILKKTPLGHIIEKESHALVVVTAEAFVELALGPKGSDLEAHALKMQRHYNNHTIIYLIEGLTPFLRKNAAARNRQFQAAVRAADAANNDNALPPPSTQGQRRRKEPKPPPPTFDETIVEDALLSLQVIHNALVHHTVLPVETAEWIVVFTQQISTIPKRRQRDLVQSRAAFCMDSGQVRTGHNATDTWWRMLATINQVTTPMAHSIAGNFKSVGELVRGLETEGPRALEGIEKGSNRDGGFTNRALGQAISKRVYKIFTATDENSSEI